MMDEVKDTMSTRDKIVKIYYSYVRMLIKLTPLKDLNPNTISVLASIMGVVAGAAFLTGHSFTAGIFLLISGALDTFDGTVARMNNRSTKFGAIVDSSLDRYVEFVLFLGIINYYRNTEMFYWGFAALAGSIMVSYARARAQTLGVHKIVGLMQRAERLILLSLGAIVNTFVEIAYDTDVVLRVTIIILAIGANFTAFQRIMLVKKSEDGPTADP